MLLVFLHHRESAELKIRENKAMRISVDVDDQLLAEAKKATRIEKTSSLLRYAIKYYAAYEAMKYIKTLGGTEPGLKLTPRRRLERRK